MNMRIISKWMTFVMGLCLLTTMASAQGTAYTRTDAPVIDGEHVAFKINKLQMRTFPYQDSFPAIQGISSGSRVDWLMIQIEYEWSIDVPDRRTRVDYVQQGARSNWLDRLEFDWRVVLAQPSSGATVSEDRGGGFNINEDGALRMARTVTYANVKDGDKHLALIFVEGRGLDRYINRIRPSMVFCDVRIKANGRDVGRMTSHGDSFFYMASRDERGREAERAERERAKFMPRSGSRGASFYVSERVKIANEMLRNRMQTPWQWSRESVLQTILTEEIQK